MASRKIASRGATKSSTAQHDWLAVLTAAAAVGTFIVGSVASLLAAVWGVASQFNKINASVTQLAGNIESLEVRVGAMDDRLKKVEGFVDEMRPPGRAGVRGQE